MAVVTMHNVTPGISAQRQLRRVEITSAQILLLHQAANVVEVIPAPGAGKVVVIDEVVAYKPAGTAYANVAGGDDLELRYNNSTGHEAVDIETDGFLDEAGFQRRWNHGPTADFDIPANQRIVAHLGGAVTDGTSSVFLDIYYYVLDDIGA